MFRNAVSGPSCNHCTTFHGLCVQCGYRVSAGEDVQKLGTSLNFSTKREPNFCRDGYSFGNNNAQNSKKVIHRVRKTSTVMSGLYSKNPSKYIQRPQIGKLKLRLVLDLDETLIHTVKISQCVPQKCINNLAVNGDMLCQDWKVVPSRYIHFHENDRKFQGVGVDFQLGVTTYRLICRPNLLNFMRTMANYYNVFIYTHGTVQYAETILKLAGVRQFVSGLYGRNDENEGFKKKDLRKMLCCPQQSIIIDDRERVWSREDRANVLVVDAFKGNLNDNQLFFVAKFLVGLKQQYESAYYIDVRRLLNKFKAMNDMLDNNNNDDNDNGRMQG